MGALYPEPHELQRKARGGVSCLRSMSWGTPGSQEMRVSPPVLHPTEDALWLRRSAPGPRTVCQARCPALVLREGLEQGCPRPSRGASTLCAQLRGESLQGGRPRPQAAAPACAAGPSAARSAVPAATGPARHVVLPPSWGWPGAPCGVPGWAPSALASLPAPRRLPRGRPIC